MVLFLQKKTGINTREISYLKRVIIIAVHKMIKLPLIRGLI